MPGPFDAIQSKPLVDRVGKRLGEGDVIHVIGGKVDAMWQVHEITPVLEVVPGVPPGAMRVTVVSSETLIVMPGQPIPGVLLVLSREQQEKLQKQALALHGNPDGTHQ